MEWSGSDILVAGALAIAALGAIVGAWRQGRKNTTDTANHEYDYTPRGRVLVTLTQEDRDLIRTNADRLVGAIKELTEIISRHRYAIGDQTAEIRRQPPPGPPGPPAPPGPPGPPES